MKKKFRDFAWLLAYMVADAAAAQLAREAFQEEIRQREILWSLEQSYNQQIIDRLKAGTLVP